MRRVNGALTSPRPRRPMFQFGCFTLGQSGHGARLGTYTANEAAAAMPSHIRKPLHLGAVAGLVRFPAAPAYPAFPNAPGLNDAFLHLHRLRHTI
jgi:hypothetical protein